MNRRRWLTAFVIALLLSVLLLCHVERETHGVWHVITPVMSVVGLRDSWTGLVLWVYMWGEYQGQWKEGQWWPAVPTPSPYPTNTPYPTATREMPLQEA